MPIPSPDDRSNSQVETDLWTIVGGNFTEDALGESAYHGVIARVEAAPEKYLDVFDSWFLGADIDADAHSQLYPHVFLRLVMKKIPDRARRTASQLLNRYKQTPSHIPPTQQQSRTSEDQARFVQRMDHRRRSLEALANSKPGT